MICTYTCVHRVLKCICCVFSCSCYDIQIHTMAGYMIYPVSILCLLDSTVSAD